MPPTHLMLELGRDIAALAQRSASWTPSRRRRDPAGSQALQSHQRGVIRTVLLALAEEIAAQLGAERLAADARPWSRLRPATAPAGTRSKRGPRAGMLGAPPHLRESTTAAT